jgi:K+-transporting ATPase ATPase A chain
MHDSFTPLGGMVPMVLMQLGEVVFGGVGSGLYGMLVFAILAVFIAGLMIGRTPEYLGKKIEAHEMKMDVDRHPGHAAAGAAGHGDRGDGGRWPRRHCQPRARTASPRSSMPSSAANNNGSAFAGLSANTPFYNWLLGWRCGSGASA